MTTTQLITWTVFTVVINAAVTILLMKLGAKAIAKGIWKGIEPHMDEWADKHEFGVEEEVEAIDNGEVKP